MSKVSLESSKATSEHVPEHQQFAKMMKNIYIHMQHEKQTEHNTLNAAKSLTEISDLIHRLHDLGCKNV